MADTKISALTVATTPLAGTEVLPIVQSGVTKQVSVADLTAGRAVSALSLSLTNALTAANGGTGQSSYAVGDLLYASTTTALSKLADVATGNALISGGVGVAPSWGKIGLTTHVSGTLPVANGGTNASSAGIAAFNNITGYTATGATGTTSTNLVFSTSPSITTPTLVGDSTLSTGNLIIGTAGKGITGSATNGDIPITPNGTGVVVVGSGNSGKQQRVRTQKHTFYTAKNTTADTVFLEVDFGSTVGAAIVDIVASGNAPGYDAIRYAVRFFCDKNSATTVTATAITTQGTASMITAAASGTKVQFSIKYFATASQTQNNFVGAEVLCVGGQTSETTVTASLV